MMAQLLRLLLILVCILTGASADAGAPAFIESVDLSPLRHLAAKQGGRIVPLRTFAEAFVRDVHGDLPMQAMDGTEVDAVVVLLESVLDPERAMEWCTIVPAGGGEPRLAGEALEQIAFGTVETDANRAGDLAVLEARLALIVFASEELVLVPHSNSDWVSVAAIEDEQLAFERDRLIAAWRTGDAQTINASLRDFAASIETLQGTAGVKRWVLRLERTWERIPLLSVAVVGYLLAGISASVRFRRSAIALLVGGLSVHLSGVIVRALIMDRLPVQNHYESMAAIAVMVAIGTFVLGRRKDGGTLLAIGSVLAAVLLGAAEWLNVPGRVLELEAGILSSTAILKYHVLTILAGYALILLGAGVGGAVLLKRLRGATLDDVSALHRLQTSIGFWVFWVLGLGILLGAVWADRAWGRWWAFDPKETWAMITWMVYLAMVHIPASKLAAHRRPVVVALLHLFGLLAMLWTYFGVNLLLPSLHSYA